MTALLQLLFFIAALVPPDSVTVSDNPNDQGGAILISWRAPTKESIPVVSYHIFRSTSPDSGFQEIGSEPGTRTEHLDNEVQDGKAYYYYVQARTENDSSTSDVAGPVVSRAQWFNTGRTNVLVLATVICAIFLYYIGRARRGVKMFVRRIAGLDAIDDALGRATEMGRPILFSFGLGYITDMVVIAALPLLRKIAMKSAEYAVRLLVPNADPIVMTAAQETVKEAYTESGRPDLYNADNVNFLTSDQFGYAAGVDGLILRERPGAIFWLGYFYAESLIMAETGHAVGAIQLAGTTETTQLPFFVAACDYTMIGEEIYAASCYLKPEPVMLGTLKGEDFIKMLLIIFITGLVLFGTIGFLVREPVPIVARIFDTITAWLLPAG
ncbi:MAG: fibronectin type III domain-containing protein [candidate division WOR-3 bacterium]